MSGVLAGTMVIFRYGDGAFAVTGWGIFWLIVLAVLAGK